MKFRLSILAWLFLSQAGALAQAQQPEDVAAELRKLANELASVDQLLKDLGSPKYQVREQATRVLSEMLLPPAEKLKSLSKEGDAEQRFRAQVILAAPPVESEHLDQLIQSVHREKLPGLLRELLIILEHSGSTKLSWSFEQAILATTSAGDVAILQKALQSPEPLVRISALNVLAQMKTDEATSVLLSHIEEPNERVRLALGEGLAKLGRREALPLLIRLLTSPDDALRTRAVIMLQSVTGRSDDSLVATTDQQLEENKIAWEQWLAAQGGQLRLRPLEATIGIASPFDE